MKNSFKSTLPDTSSNQKFHNLTADVKIYRDGYGIPHIKATKAKDAFFGQGFAYDL